MGEHARTAEARSIRIRAACTSMVAGLDAHREGMSREDAVKALGFCVGTMALAWGDPAEVVSAVNDIARAVTREIGGKS